jgi:hypothetical protein
MRAGRTERMLAVWPVHGDARMMLRPHTLTLALAAGLPVLAVAQAAAAPLRDNA